MLVEAGLTISMTQANHCYENAQAERLNGILKQEYGLGETLASKREALALVHEAVGLYNDCRPHEALGYAYPGVVHAGVARPLARALPGRGVACPSLAPLDVSMSVANATVLPPPDPTLPPVTCRRERGRESDKF